MFCQMSRRVSFQSVAPKAKAGAAMRALPAAVVSHIKITTLSQDEVRKLGGRNLVVEQPASAKERAAHAEMCELVARHAAVLKARYGITAAPPLPQTPTDHETGKPLNIAAQLNSRALGSTSFRQRCDTCHESCMTGCGCHMGLSDLYWPVAPVSLAATVFRTLVHLCYFCSRIKSAAMEEALLARYDAYTGGRAWDALSEYEQFQWYKTHDKWMRDTLPNVTGSDPRMKRSKTEGEEEDYELVYCAHCDMPQPFYKLVQSDRIAVLWPTHNLARWQNNPPVHVVDRLLQHVIRHHLAELMLGRHHCNKQMCTKPECWAEPMLNDAQVPVWIAKTARLLSAPLWTAEAMFSAADVRVVLEGMSARDALLFALDPTFNHPKDMVWSVIPLVGKHARPQASESLPGAAAASNKKMQRSRDGLTSQYMEIEKHAALLRGMLYASKLAALKELVDEAFVRAASPHELAARVRWIATPTKELWRIYTDARGCAAFNPTALFRKTVSNLQYEVSVTVDAKSASGKKPKGHHTSKTGAKRAAAAAPPPPPSGDNAPTAPTPTAKRTAPRPVAATAAVRMSAVWSDERRATHSYAQHCLCSVLALKRAGVWEAHYEIWRADFLRALRGRAAIEPLAHQLSVLPDADVHVYYNKKIPPSILGKQGTKKGRFLNDLLGKRTDHSGRLVASSDAYIRLGAVRVPRWVLAEQLKQVTVHAYNISAIRDAVQRGLGPYRVAFIITDENRVIHLDTERGRTSHKRTFPHATIQIGWHVFVSLQPGDLVVVNRQPSLQEASFNAHPMEAGDADTIGSSQDNNGAYNLDYDGDVMALLFLLSQWSRIETALLMSVANN